MPKSSEDYWRAREEEQRKHNIEEEKEYQKEIDKIYKQMMSEIDKQIYAFYAKYASQNAISMAEAKKRADKLDIEAYAEKAKKYVKEKDFSTQANREMKIYNLTMKANRLELLKAQLGLELCAGSDEIQSFMEEKLEGRTLEEIERQAGILGKSVLNNKEFAHSLVNASFHNATFSDRIWAQQANLRNELSNILTNALIAGRNPRDFIPQIRKRFDVTRSQANRLLVTELARVQTEAQMQSFKRNGFDEYTFLALGTACEVCKRIDGKHFKVEKANSGINMPPMHPNCRCSTSAYMDDEEYNAWLDGYKDHGLTFEEWKNMNREAKNSYITSENEDSALKKRTYKVAPINTVQDIQPYFDAINFIFADDELKNYIKNELCYMPKRDLEILKKRPVFIRKTNGNSNYIGGGKLNLISINTNYNPGSFGHEFAHYIVSKANFNDGLINCLENVFANGVSIRVGHYKRGDFITVESQMFVRPYQGRTNLTADKLEDGQFEIQAKDLWEYVSVGYEYYIIDPWTLLEKDEMLYNYFERGGMFE